jgi:hypothetical protein
LANVRNIHSLTPVTYHKGSHFEAFGQETETCPAGPDTGEMVRKSVVTEQLHGGPTAPHVSNDPPHAVNSPCGSPPCGARPCCVCATLPCQAVHVALWCCPRTAPAPCGRASCPRADASVLPACLQRELLGADRRGPQGHGHRTARYPPPIPPCTRWQRHATFMHALLLGERGREAPAGLL